MSEDEPSMTDDEIKDAAISEIIAGLGLVGFTVTKEEIIGAVRDEELRKKFRSQIEEAHRLSDLVESHSPGKNLSNLVVMHQMGMITFTE